MALPQALPTTDPLSVAGALTTARRLAQLLGPAWQPADGTNIAGDFLAMGSALAQGRADLLAALAEAFPDTTVQCIAEWEGMIGAPSGAGLALPARQAALLAWYQTRFGGDPRDILTAVQNIDPTATITEFSATLAATAGFPRVVFVYAIVLASSVFWSAATFARISALVGVMSPSHTLPVLTTQVGFRFDDSGSVFDNTLFGD